MTDVLRGIARDLNGNNLSLTYINPAQPLESLTLASHPSKSVQTEYEKLLVNDELFVQANLRRGAL